LLPLLNSGRIELLDNPRLIMQLANLERRTARGGRDSIDHPIGQHDDVSNVVALLGSIVISSSGGYSLEVWKKAFGDPTEDEPPSTRYVPADGSSVPFIPLDMRMQYEREEAAKRGKAPAPLPIHPTPETIRAVFAKLEDEQKRRVPS
jgi:hypothetical protein